MGYINRQFKLLVYNRLKSNSLSFCCVTAELQKTDYKLFLYEDSFFTL